MLKEFFSAFKGDLKPVAKLEDGREVIHQDYKVAEENRGKNFEHKIARYVLKQNILNKDDFIAFVKEYKTVGTKIFFNNSRIKAIFNYTTLDKADYHDSFCEMQLENTKNFDEFKNILDRDLSQKDFIRILKRLEGCIVGFNNAKADDMDIIEVAENLQATKNFQSVQRNTLKAFTVDAEVKAGNKNYEIPRYIHFKIPIYKNDLLLEVQFDCELFLEATDGGFIANLVCYKLDEIIEKTIRDLTKDVCESCEGVSSFMI